MLTRLGLVLLVSVSTVDAGSSIADGRYHVTKIGVGDVYAVGLNEHHDVVGYVMPGGSWHDAYAFLWSADTGLTAIGGYAARDINDLGQIAGQAAWIQAGVWENGSWIALPDRQNVYSINNSGQITGLISAQPSIPGPYAPYRDDDIYAPGFVELERPYQRASHGFDINEHGEVVADCGTGLPGTLYIAVFYRTDGSYVILDNDGNYDSHARAINDSRQIAGNARARQDSGSDHVAVFWASPDSNMEYMGALGDGYSVSRAINNSGQAVGFSSDRAFIWTQADGMSDLNALIYPDLGMTLTEASDVSNNGTIAARGLNSTGEACSYLLTPAITTEIRIVPQTFHLRSRGRWITAHIHIPEEYDLDDVILDSVVLGNQIEPVRIWTNEPEEVITAKFSRATVQELLELLERTGTVNLIVSGDLVDGTKLQGRCSLNVID